MPAQQLARSTPATPARAAMLGGALPYNPSSQRLVGSGDDTGEDSSRNASSDSLRASPKGLLRFPEDRQSALPATPNHVTRRQWCTVLILFFVNLINYMDRLTIAGILSKIQNEYDIGDGQAGLLQTAFVVSYMVFAPIFGYLGDRHSRRVIMAVGVAFWTAFTIIGSFMPNYWSFLLCRAMVGIGEASYSTIAPTIISDMFVKDKRSKMLALFYFAIPVGSGLGYVVGAETTQLAGDWRWGIRVTPILGVFAVVMILFFMVDPPRGESEGHGHLEATTYVQDLRSLARNRSFVFSTLAFTCVAFCTGALSWWGPKFIEAAIASSPSSVEGSFIGINNVALVFGFVTMMSGIVGVPLGSILSTKLSPKHPRADPLICAVGLIVSSGFLLVGMYAANRNIYLAFAMLFLGEVMLNLNWSIVADVLLYVVVPTRRSSAEAIQILISHAFGDAGSPYLIGMVSDALRGYLSTNSDLCVGPNMDDVPDMAGLKDSYPANHTICDFTVDFYSMQYALFINNAVEVVGGIFFIITAIYIIRDKQKCIRYIADQKVFKAVQAKDPEFHLMLNSYPALVLKGESESSVSSDDDIPPTLQPMLQPQV